MFVVTGAAYLNFVKRTVASAVIEFTFFHVTCYAEVNVFHMSSYMRGEIRLNLICTIADRLYLLFRVPIDKKVNSG